MTIFELRLWVIRRIEEEKEFVKNLEDHEVSAVTMSVGAMAAYQEVLGHLDEEMSESERMKLKIDSEFHENCG